MFGRVSLLQGERSGNWQRLAISALTRRITELEARSDLLETFSHCWTGSSPVASILAMTLSAKTQVDLWRRWWGFYHAGYPAGASPVTSSEISVGSLSKYPMPCPWRTRLFQDHTRA